MYTTPEGYRDAVESLDRTIDIFLSLGVNIDSTSADDIQSITGDFLPMSNVSQATDATYALDTNPATFEGYGIPTALSNGVTAPPIAPTEYPPEIGIWSASISDASGNIDFAVTINLSSVHRSAFRIYTQDVNVLEATATFHVGDVETEAEFECTDGMMTIIDLHEYDRIEILISKVDQPYHHVRIVEIEFGASRTVSRSELGGEIVYIDEIDPLEISMPLSELDFSLMNVLGDYDTDNPSSRFNDIVQGYPVVLSYTVSASDGQRYTVPCGRFLIDSKEGADYLLTVTAFDQRWVFKNLYMSWTLPGDQSLGDTLDALFDDYSIPHVVDEDVYDIMPDSQHTFDDTTSILDDLLAIQQRYAVYLIPARDGTIHITTSFPSGEYGDTTINGIYAYPYDAVCTRYNYIQIRYGAQLFYNLDLRAVSTEAKTILAINNDLITTEEAASVLAERIASRIYTELMETDWRGDPALDAGDDIGIPGRWTQDDPITYRITRTEMTYDGSFRMLMTGTQV